jgi:hypothetical protein
VAEGDEDADLQDEADCEVDGLHAYARPAAAFSAASPLAVVTSRLRATSQRAKLTSALGHISPGSFLSSGVQTLPMTFVAR